MSGKKQVYDLEERLLESNGGQAFLIVLIRYPGAICHLSCNAWG